MQEMIDCPNCGGQMVNACRFPCPNCGFIKDCSGE